MYTARVPAALGVAEDRLGAPSKILRIVSPLSCSDSNPSSIDCEAIQGNRDATYSGVNFMERMAISDEIVR